MCNVYPTWSLFSTKGVFKGGGAIGGTAFPIIFKEGRKKGKKEEKDKREKGEKRDKDKRINKKRGKNKLCKSNYFPPLIINFAPVQYSDNF